MASRNYHPPSSVKRLCGLLQRGALLPLNFNSMKKMLLFVLSVSFSGAMGQVVKNVQIVDVVSNKTVSLDSYASPKGILIVFTSNSCPYDEYYRNRIAAISKAYQNRVPVLLVNGYTEPAESAENMLAKAQHLKLNVPYLADKNQALIANLDVRKSPEAFLLKTENGNFSVVYRGAIDDNPQVEADVRHYYLRDAMDALLANQKIKVPQVRAVGCNIKRTTGP
jgi:thioredoxin-related protein